MGIESSFNFEYEAQKHEELSSREVYEGNEKFKENELILPEGDFEKAKDLLKENHINFEERQYTERKEVGQNGWVPAEFILVIKNNKGEDESFDKVKEVFTFLKENGITVRYGFNPEINDEDNNDEAG